MEHVDTVILATGYRPQVGYLRGTAALGLEGEPLQRRGVSTTLPGLAYVGLEFQRCFASATVRGVGRRVRDRPAARSAPARRPGRRSPSNRRA